MELVLAIVPLLRPFHGRLLSFPLLPATGLRCAQDARAVHIMAVLLAILNQGSVNVVSVKPLEGRSRPRQASATGSAGPWSSRLRRSGSA